ncbi:Na/Pi symporter [Aquabacter cavernae]|uniref:Na/Pi symporter n=1 Tax=Aquabacter cavernae TaxID=2496029 RepID=UPI0013DF0C67|nr:Na/Pi symporter [Aquabacter cavernae]
MAVVIGLLCGLGFIFIGTQFLTANMKQVVGPGFQRLVARATGHPLRASLVGILAGATIQSTNAVTFIVIGLVSAGAATVRSAMPIVTWSSAGSTLRLLLASFDIGLVVMSGIALIGLAYLLGYDRDARYRNFIAAILGLFLLLYGVQLITGASGSLRESETLKAVLAFADQFYFWGFLAGTVLAAVVQGQTVAVVVVALAAANVLSMDQACLIVVGANFGTGFMTLAQGSGLKGTARQLNLYQFVLKSLGAAILLPLFTIEHYTGIPLLLAFVTSITADAALQVTAVHWMFQISSAVAASTINGPLFALIERLSPPTEAENLSKPMFITAYAESLSVTALKLAEQEQRRLVRRLPHFLDRVRHNPGVTPADDETTATAANASPKDLRQAGTELARDLDVFLKHALQNPGTPAEQDALMGLWNSNQLLHGLHAALGTMAGNLEDLAKAPALTTIASRLADETHAMLAAVIARLETFDAGSLAAIRALTSERSDALRQMRDDILKEAPDLPADQQKKIWQTMDHLEETTWLLRRLTANLAAGPLGDLAAPRA